MWPWVTEIHNHNLGREARAARTARVTHATSSLSWPYWLSRLELRMSQLSRFLHLRIHCRPDTLHPAERGTVQSGSEAQLGTEAKT